MIPPRIQRRQDFINAIARNDNKEIFMGFWGAGPNFHCADPNFGEYSTVTPLMAALDRGNAKLVDRLLKHPSDPADPNAICEGVALFTTGDFGDFLFISPLARCIQRHYVSTPEHKQTFEEIYGMLRDNNANLYAAPSVKSEDKTPTQNMWQRNIENQMNRELTVLHTQLEEQYQQQKANQHLKSKLQNAINHQPELATRKQKI